MAGDTTVLSNKVELNETEALKINSDGDIPKIEGMKNFMLQFIGESHKLWYLCGPSIFTGVCQYSPGAVTQILASHLGSLELAAFSVENSVIAGFSFGIMLGMASVLETLCGQAYGAGQKNMLGVYLQRSWVIMLVTAVLLMFSYIFATPLLKLTGQEEDISNAAGELALWMIPQLFAYALNFPIAKFLQAQRKLMVMACISAVALLFHIVFSWVFMFILGWGLEGGAVILNLSWWFIVVARFIYVSGGGCDETWSGFSWAAFHDLWGFMKLSIATFFTCRPMPNAKSKKSPTCIPNM